MVGWWNYKTGIGDGNSGIGVILNFSPSGWTFGGFQSSKKDEQTNNIKVM